MKINKILSILVGIALSFNSCLSFGSVSPYDTDDSSNVIPESYPTEGSDSYDPPTSMTEDYDNYMDNYHAETENDYTGAGENTNYTQPETSEDNGGYPQDYGTYEDQHDYDYNGTESDYEDPNSYPDNTSPGTGEDGGGYPEDYGTYEDPYGYDYSGTEDDPGTTSPDTGDTPPETDPDYDDLMPPSDDDIDIPPEPPLPPGPGTSPRGSGVWYGPEVTSEITSDGMYLYRTIKYKGSFTPYHPYGFLPTFSIDRELCIKQAFYLDRSGSNPQWVQFEDIQTLTHWKDWDRADDKGNYRHVRVTINGGDVHENTTLKRKAYNSDGKIIFDADWQESDGKKTGYQTEHDYMSVSYEYKRDTISWNGEEGLYEETYTVETPLSTTGTEDIVIVTSNSTKTKDGAVVATGFYRKEKQISRSTGKLVYIKEERKDMQGGVCIIDKGYEADTRGSIKSASAWNGYSIGGLNKAEIEVDSLGNIVSIDAVFYDDDIYIDGDGWGIIWDWDVAVDPPLTAADGCNIMNIISWILKNSSGLYNLASEVLGKCQYASSCTP